VPFAQPETSEQGLEDLFRRKPDKPSSPEPHANTSASPAPASAAQEDCKMPSLPTKTKIDSLETAQAAAEAYQASWQRAIPEAREAMQARGQEILKDVEALKQSAKQSYRHQVLDFETQDVDPLVWKRVLQEQEAARASLNATRDLRTQLLNTCQVREKELKKGGLRTPPSNDQKAELYSSDEDEQQLSSEAMRDRQESIKEAIDVTKEVVEAILESGPTLGAGAAVKVAGKLPKVLKATKVGSKAVQGVARTGKVGKVLQSGGHTLTNRTLKGLGLNQQQANKAIEVMKKEYRIPSNFHGQIMSNGDYIDPHAKKCLGNLFDFID
jgi:hypothetical protein